MARVAKIEQIDEVEELNLVLEHYAVSWGNVAGHDTDDTKGDEGAEGGPATTSSPRRGGIGLQRKGSQSP